jgi:hypothetical protein
MLKLFEFKDNKLTTLPSLLKQQAKAITISLLLIALISILASALKLTDKQFWRIYTLLINHFNASPTLPAPKKQKQQEAKIELELDEAIKRYEQWEATIPPTMTNPHILSHIASPKFSPSQRLIIQNAIYYECQDGSMGIRGSWTSPPPNCS